MTDAVDNALEQLAQNLDRSLLSQRATPQWSGPVPLTLAQAYQVQSHGAALRCARGDAVVGLKQAFTNRAMMQRMGIAEPVTGLLCRGSAIDPFGITPGQKVQGRIDGLGVAGFSAST